MESTIDARYRRELNRDAARERTMHAHPANCIARVPYAWPGGYDVCGVTDGGDVICARCVRARYADYRRAERADGDRNYRLTLTTTQFDEHDLQCADCGVFLVTCWRADNFNPEGPGECEEGCLMVYPPELLP